MPEKCLKILVIDDEPIMCNLLYDLLTKEGHAVIAVSNGLDAVNYIAQNPFDLIFTDMHMPELNGWETIQEIRKISPFVPIVIMSSFYDEIVSASEKEGSILASLQKPFNIKDVLEVIKITG